VGRAEGALIFIVEQDPGVIRAVKRQLERDGLRVHARKVGLGTADEVRTLSPDVVLLDLILPDVDGLLVIRGIRDVSSAQIIVLTSLDDAATKVAALESGADDYMTKPFAMAELVARLRVALRHAAGQSREPIICAGPLALDVALRKVTVNGEPVHLTPHEFSLCRLLVQHRDRIATREAILSVVWGPTWDQKGEEANTHLVRTFVSQLRAKLGDAVGIVSELGVGYRLTVPGDVHPETTLHRTDNGST
jgi:two-component system KDP operon response regulator KdpE